MTYDFIVPLDPLTPPCKRFRGPANSVGRCGVGFRGSQSSLRAGVGARIVDWTGMYHALNYLQSRVPPSCESDFYTRVIFDPID